MFSSFGLVKRGKWEISLKILLCALEMVNPLVYGMIIGVVMLSLSMTILRFLLLINRFALLLLMVLGICKSLPSSFLSLFRRTLGIVAYLLIFVQTRDVGTYPFIVDYPLRLFIILNVLNVFERIGGAGSGLSPFLCLSPLWFGGSCTISCLRMTNGNEEVFLSPLCLIFVVRRKKRNIICFFSVVMLRRFGVGLCKCPTSFLLFLVGLIFGIFFAKLVLLIPM